MTKPGSHEFVASHGSMFSPPQRVVVVVVVVVVVDVVVESVVVDVVVVEVVVVVVVVVEVVEVVVVVAKTYTATVPAPAMAIVKKPAMKTIKIVTIRKPVRGLGFSTSLFSKPSLLIREIYVSSEYNLADQASFQADCLVRA